MTRRLAVLLLALLLPATGSAQQKHALLVLGEAALPAAESRVAVTLLQAQGYTVHIVRPATSGPVVAEITRLGQLSNDPSVGGFRMFVFYFIGHGGAGMMSIFDANNKEIGSILTDNIALQVFTEISADAYTFVFDMCDALPASLFVSSAGLASGRNPEGWILGASGNPESATYGTLYTQALAGCLGGAPPASSSALDSCIHRERGTKPWYYRSPTYISEIDPPDTTVPIF